MQKSGRRPKKVKHLQQIAMNNETSVEIQEFIEKPEEHSPNKPNMSLPVSLNFTSPVIRYTAHYVFFAMLKTT